MKFTFDYTETLCRRVTIDANSLADALNEIENRIDNEELVLTAEDFLGGKISMPLEHNYSPQVYLCGEPMKMVEDMEIVLEEW